MGNSAPPPPNYRAAAQETADASQNAVNQQTQANRPNQSTPFASVGWTQGPNGQWTQNTAFSGPLAGLSESLQQQAAQAMSTPFSLSGLPGLSTGEDARKQAIDAAYGQATSRLDPQWAQREGENRSRLLGQGLAEGSEAYNNAMANLSRERNDAYGGALSSAIGQGTEAGNALFNQSLAARQQGLAEALRSRGQAFGELQGLQGLTQMPGFQGAGLAQAPDYMNALGLQQQADWQAYDAKNQGTTDAIRGGVDILKTLGPAIIPFLLSDERAKQDVRRLAVDVLPGVPLATWRYLPEHGDPADLYVGVIAQDLQRAAPEYVTARGDGMLTVHPIFAPRVHHGV